MSHQGKNKARNQIREYVGAPGPANWINPIGSTEAAWFRNRRRVNRKRAKMARKSRQRNR